MDVDYNIVHRETQWVRVERVAEVMNFVEM